MNCNIRSWHYAFCLLLLLFASTALAGETSLRNYPLPDHGSIQFQVPSIWEDHLSQPPNRLPPTIEFKQKAGHPFSMLITPIWATKKNIKLPEGDNLRKSVQEAADRIASGAVEKKINLIELNGSSAYGYYFSVTDSAPKPGEYKYLTQGHVRVGDLMVIFTILTNDGQDNIISDGFALIKSAKHNKEVSVSKTETIEIIDVKGVFRLTVPASKLILTIPKEGLIQKNVRIGGGTDNPRYFYFENAGKNIIISGWFEPAQNYPGINKYWEDKVKNWSRMGLKPPQDVYFKKVYGWNSIFYNDQIPDHTMSHISANWIQAGTWIDLHISITSNSPNDEVRAKLVEVLDSIKVLATE